MHSIHALLGLMEGVLADLAPSEVLVAHPLRSLVNRQTTSGKRALFLPLAQCRDGQAFSQVQRNFLSRHLQRPELLPYRSCPTEQRASRVSLCSSTVLDPPYSLEHKIAVADRPPQYAQCPLLPRRLHEGL